MAILAVVNGDYKSVPQAGDFITLTGGSLRAACRPGTVCSSNLITEVADSSRVPRFVMSGNTFAQPISSVSLVIQPPLVTLVPTVMLSLPTQCGACNDLNIDLSASTGNGGRPWTSVVWDVQAANGGTKVILAYLDSNYDMIANTVIIPRGLLLSTTYSFGVTLTNFFGSSTTQTSVVTVSGPFDECMQSYHDICDSSSNVLIYFSFLFSLSGDPNLPIATILGNKLIKLRAIDVLMLTGSGLLSPCASSSILSYNWTITNSTGHLLKIKSSSRDPKTFLAAPYTFPAGSSYSAMLTVSSLTAQSVIVSTGFVTASFYIAHGSVIAAVRNGYSRQVSLDQVLLLDASISSDEDTKIPVLFYSWSCSMGSLAKFGLSCNLNLTSAVSSSSVLSIPPYRMLLSNIYNFEVVVSSTDGRAASRTVSITTLLPGAPVIVSSNTRIKFNSDTALMVSATVTANVSVSCTWTAYTANNLVPLTAALTIVSRTFQASEVTSGVSYPLLLPGSTFTPGRTYVFRLSGSPLHYSALVAQTDIVLVANSPPSGGYASVSPRSGLALNTTFSYATTGWFDDLADYPLSFNFAYQLAAQKAALIINTLSPLPYASSPLPPGLLSLDNVVTIIANVIDIYGSAANATTSAKVKTDSTQSPAVFLTNYLSQALLSGNTDGAFQTMNLVSSSISISNCSASPNCTALHRAHCLLTANTCGSCLLGYKGVVGDANIPCFASSSTSGAVGFTCTVNSDCLYNLCTKNVCTAPRKTCISSSPDTICSGHGECSYTDVSNNVLDTCLITETSCTASCTCNTGYGAADCSLDATAFAVRSTTRVSICQALNKIISVSSRSAHLFDSLVSALESAYDVTEITDLAGKAECSKVVRFLGVLASRGFLAGTQASTQATFIEITSQFVGSTPALSSITGSSRRILSTASHFANDVTAAIAGVTTGTLKGMTAGQKPVSLVTKNVKATLMYELVSGLTSASLSPPLTDAEAAYGSLQSRIIVPNDGISHCSSNNYVQLSTVQFGNNPHTGSSELKSSLLQFSSLATTKTLKSSKSSQQSMSGARPHTNVVLSNKSVIPAYYIVLQFSSQQNFNLSIQDGPYDHFSNVTLPKCTLYDATLSMYVSCNNCNISSYTDFNATFGCFDITNLCPSSSAGRRLDTTDDVDNDEKLESEYGGYGHVYPLEDDSGYYYDSGYGYEDAEEEMKGNVMTVEKVKRDEVEVEVEVERWKRQTDKLPFLRKSLIELSGTDSNSSVNATSRGNGGLGTSNDDYTPSTDDGPSNSDDRYSKKSQATTSEFGSVTNAILAEHSSIFSLNPFTIDLSKGKAVLAFVGCICGCILFGLCYFLRLDKLERHRYIYLLEEKLKMKKERISENIRKGGNGVTFGRSPKKNKPDDDENSNSSFISNISTTLIKLEIARENKGNRKLSGVSHNPQIYPEVESSDDIDHASLPHVLIAQFSNEMLPRSYSLNEGILNHPLNDVTRLNHPSNDVTRTDVTRHGVNLLRDTMFTLKRTHYICSAFFGSSLRLSRTLRYIDMCKMVLLGIFIDTMIYGIFFPSDSTCTKLMTKSVCLSFPSKIIAGATLCQWNKTSGCGTLPPPQSITLTLLIAFIIIIFIIPLDYGVGYIIENFASRRPILEKWGLSTIDWLGSVYHKIGDDNSPLQAALSKGKNINSEEDTKLRKSFIAESDLNFTLRDLETETSERTEREADFVANRVYTDLSSPREELSKLMLAVQVN